MGGFPTICYNKVHDITVSLLCSNVATEPPLQPLSGESMIAHSANTDDGARVDIYARGFCTECIFWCKGVLPKRIHSNCSTDTSSVYRGHDQATKWEYGQRIREVEHAWRIHPSHSLYNRGMGGRNSLLQIPCRHDSSENITPQPSCDGMAKMSALFCFIFSIHHMHSRQQILFSPFYLWVRHHLATSDGQIPSV